MTCRACGDWRWSLGQDRRQKRPETRNRKQGAELARHGDRFASCSTSLAGQPVSSDRRAAGPADSRVGGTMLTFYTNDTVASDDFAARAQAGAGNVRSETRTATWKRAKCPKACRGSSAGSRPSMPTKTARRIRARSRPISRQQQAGLRAQIHAKATDREDVCSPRSMPITTSGSTAARWKACAAAAGRARQQIATADLTSDELPEVLLIGLARGSLENADATFAPPPRHRPRPGRQSPPLVHRHGRQQRRRRSAGASFSGLREKFQELDRDANGLLELAETPNATKDRPIVHCPRSDVTSRLA